MKYMRSLGTSYWRSEIRGPLEDLYVQDRPTDQISLIDRAARVLRRVIPLHQHLRQRRSLG